MVSVYVHCMVETLFLNILLETPDERDEKI